VDDKRILETSNDMAPPSTATPVATTPKAAIPEAETPEAETPVAATPTGNPAPTTTTTQKTEA